MKDKFPYVIVLELCRFRCERDGQSLHQGVLRPVSSKTLALHQSTSENQRRDYSSQRRAGIHQAAR